MAHHDYIEEIIPYNTVLHRQGNGVITDATHVQYTINSATDGLAIKFTVHDTVTIDKFEVWVDAGTAADNFRCRICNSTAAGLTDTASLVHANADVTLSSVGGSAAWLTFDFTNFSLAAGDYWIALTASSAGAFSLVVTYMPDYATPTTGPEAHNKIATYDGDWDNSNTLGAVRGRLKSTGGWIYSPGMAPCEGYSSVNNLIMDTSENPDCRGSLFVAPYSGDVIGVAFSPATFLAGTSVDIVLADSACAAALERVEVLRGHSQAWGPYYAYFNTPVTVTAGTTYAIYATPGSQAGASTGAGLSAIDLSSDNTLIECYGVPQNTLKGFYVHQPPSEGGAGSVTSSYDYVIPMVPIYGALDVGGGGAENVTVW